MTHIYSLSQDDGYQALVQVDADGEIAYDESIAIRSTALCGKPFGSDYEPVELTWGSSRRKKTSDVQAMLTPFIVFSERAMAELATLLGGSGQVLPVVSPISGMTGFHVTRLLEGAVDLSASVYKEYPEAIVFTKVVLRAERVLNVDIFRLKESPATVFVSDVFKQRVQDAKLKGFDFSEQVPLSEG